VGQRQPRPNGWPADKVKRWPIDRLIPYARNARTHSPAQIDQIAASIKEWGWTNPVLVAEDDTIIAGHGRVLAAHKLRINDVPVMVATGWSEAQKKAYALADNKLALNAGWDDALLALEIAELQEIGFEIDLIGFDNAELAALGGEVVGLTDPDDVPETPVDPVSRVGDVWLLGRHRLVCGDSTSEADVHAALGSVRPHLMVTDPPYGVDYDPSWRADANKWKGSKVKLGAKATGRVSNDDMADWTKAWELFPGDVAYVWHGGLRSVEQAHGLEQAGFVIRSQIIWDKTRLVISRGDYHWQHEACWYAVRKAKTGHWNGSRTQSTVWAIPKSSASETGHGTQKPVECMKRPIENNSSPGQAIYEPFSGSGTTIIAAEITGRACHAIELMPQYVDVAVERWQAFTGGLAKLESDGRTFADVGSERGKQADGPPRTQA
jgi:DNA modification methylase